MTLNFARRPFRDYRPVYLVAGAALLVGGILLAVNARLYGEFRRDVADIREEIAWLEKRQQAAAATAESARNSLKASELSSLAIESRGLLRLVEERQLSWTLLLQRLERVLPPEVRLSRLQPTVTDTGEINVEIQLVGPSSGSVVRTLVALARSPYFTAIDLKTETRPDADKGVPEGFSFALSTVYDPAVP